MELVNQYPIQSLSGFSTVKGDLVSRYDQSSELAGRVALRETPTQK